MPRIVLRVLKRSLFVKLCREANLRNFRQVGGVALSTLLSHPSRELVVKQETYEKEKTRRGKAAPTAAKAEEGSPEANGRVSEGSTPLVEDLALVDRFRHEVIRPPAEALHLVQTEEHNIDAKGEGSDGRSETLHLLPPASVVTKRFRDNHEEIGRVVGARVAGGVRPKENDPLGVSMNGQLFCEVRKKGIEEAGHG